MKHKLRNFLCSLLLIGSSSVALAAPGDYNGDGLSDMSLGLVDRTNNFTAYLTRLSNGGSSLFWVFNQAADAYAPGKYFDDGKTYPAIVYVSDANSPLNWIFKKPDGTELSLVYGRAGDTIPNHGPDFDGDGISDLYTIRDGNSTFYPGFRVWYIALSGAGNGIQRIVFGLSTDFPFAADMNGDGEAEMGVIRPDTMEWITREVFNDTVTNVQWGLPGDLPLLPQDINLDNKADYVISRRGANGQLAYVRFSGESTTTAALGQPTSIPMLGEFKSNQNPGFAWQQRDTGWAAIRSSSSGKLSIFRHGLSTNDIIRPDGTVVQASSDGTIDLDGEDEETPSTEVPTTGGTGFCPQVLSVTEGGKFIYKQSAPIRSGGVGTPLVGYRKEPTLIMNVNISNRGTMNVYDSKGNVLTSCPWASAHDAAGGRARCTAQTSSVRRKAIANTGSANILFKVNASQCVSVPDAGRCYGSVKGLCNQLIQ